MFALETVPNAVVLIKVAAELAERTNALLPVVVSLGNAATAVDELIDIGTAKVAHIVVVLGGEAGWCSVRVGAAGVVRLGSGHEEEERIRIFFNRVDHIMLAGVALIAWLFERTVRAVLGNRVADARALSAGAAGIILLGRVVAADGGRVRRDSRLRRARRVS